MNMFKRLSAWFFTKLANAIVAAQIELQKQDEELATKLARARRHEEEISQWARNNSKLIHRERAKAILEERNVPSVYELYIHFKEVSNY